MLATIAGCRSEKSKCSGSLSYEACEKACTAGDRDSCQMKDVLTSNAMHYCLEDHNPAACDAVCSRLGQDSADCQTARHGGGDSGPAPVK